MQTISFEDLKGRFQAVSGLQTLDATDIFFMLNSMNLHLREAWDRAKWPELLNIEEVAIGATPTFGKASAQVDHDVLNVYDKNPWENPSARSLYYTLIDSRIVLQAQFPQGTIFVLKKVPFVNYTEDSTDIPAFFEKYASASILADFYRGDAQSEKAQFEEQRSEEILLRQIDRVERLEQQNTPQVGQYTRNVNRSIFQTT